MSDGKDSLEVNRTESREVTDKYFLLPPKISRPVWSGMHPSGFCSHVAFWLTAARRAVPTLDMAGKLLVCSEQEGQCTSSGLRCVTPWARCSAKPAHAAPQHSLCSASNAVSALCKQVPSLCSLFPAGKEPSPAWEQTYSWWNSLKKSQRHQVAQGHVRLDFECLQGQRLVSLPGSLLLCLDTSMVKKLFLISIDS